jgi:[ribosomal protein S5]-alanine N-acetyltransferase
VREAPERVHTPRLTCERLEPEHADELMVLLCDPRVAASLYADARIPTPDQVVEQLGVKVAHWERFGFGLWLLRDRESGRMVGRGGLQHTFLAGSTEVEVAWAIVPERWNQGLATELAQASVDVAFETLRLPGIIAFTLPENHASRRVMEKTGFTYDSDVIHAGLPHVLYRRAPDSRPE